MNGEKTTSRRAKRKTLREPTDETGRWKFEKIFSRIIDSSTNLPLLSIKLLADASFFEDGGVSSSFKRVKMKAIFKSKPRTPAEILLFAYLRSEMKEAKWEEKMTDLSKHIKELKSILYGNSESEQGLKLVLN
ncbi:putative MO25-like protein [Nymphaea thermarum]|nr:putative MO25-like protein [Nymphaea thermarum]